MENRFEDYGDYIKIFVKDKEFVIDKDDVSKFNGYLKDGKIFLKGSFSYNSDEKYMRYTRLVNGKVENHKVHRYILGLEDTDFQVNHLDQNPLNNRKDNLEIVNGLRVKLKSKEELEEFKQYTKDNGFEDYDEAYLYWKGYLK